jgi:hypothetical protein
MQVIFSRPEIAQATDQTPPIFVTLDNTMLQMIGLSQS